MELTWISFCKGQPTRGYTQCKVTAQVQLPDGTPKTINMNYDTEGKHYTVCFLKGNWEYKVAILSEINGEKVNGRFIFSR